MTARTSGERTGIRPPRRRRASHRASPGRSARSSNKPARLPARVLSCSATLALLTLLAAASVGCSKPPLSHEVFGCNQVLRDGTCVLPRSGEVRLAIRSAPRAAVHVVSGWRQMGSGVTDAEGALVLSVVLPKSAPQTRLWLRRGAQVTVQAVAVRPFIPIPWLNAITTDEDERGRKRAAVVAWLKAHPALPLPERARAAFFLAEWAYLDRLPTAEVVALHEEALRLAKAVGHVQDEARLALYRILMVRNSRPNMEEALRLRDEHQAAIDRIPDVREILPLYLAQIAALSGDLRAALPLARAAAVRAERAGLARTRCLAEQQAALVLTDMGDDARADAIFERLLREAERPDSPCPRCEILTDYSASRLLRWEETPPEPEAAAAVQQKLAEIIARPTFEGCQRPNEVAFREQLRAGAALFRGDGDEAGRALAAAQAAFPSERQTPSRRLDWLDLAARQARFAGDLSAAQRHADAEAREARAAAQVPAQHRAALQLAQIALAQRQAALVAARFQEAEALLEAPALRLPPCVLPQGARHADPRCSSAPTTPPSAAQPDDALTQQPCAAAGLRPALQERGTAAYLDWLLQTDQPAAAVAVVRRARQRQQQALRLQQNLEGLDDVRLARFRAGLARYQRLRGALEEDVRRNSELPGDELLQAEQGQQALRAQVSQALQEALGVLQDQPLPPPQPLALDAGEAALLCHPLAQGYGCWLVPGGGAPLGFRADLSALADLRAAEPFARAAALSAVSRALAPACAALRPLAVVAGRLRLIPYGALRQLDLAAVPWPCEASPAGAGQPLGDRLTVVYSLDTAAPVPAAPAPAPRAVLVFDPTENLQKARDAAPAVCARLRGAGYALQPFGHLAPPGCGPGAAALATSSAVLAALPGASLFHYDGHALAAGWQSALQLDQCTRVLPGDILALKAAPRLVVLLGCSTARAGGHALEDMALAQAFISAGSQAVIATARNIRDEDAAWLAQRLYQERREARPALLEDPAAALQAAQRALRKDRPTSDWSAFRVYVP